jgi:hypothetical protein
VTAGVEVRIAHPAGRREVEERPDGTALIARQPTEPLAQEGDQVVERDRAVQHRDRADVERLVRALQIEEGGVLDGESLAAVGEEGGEEVEHAF